MNYENNQYLILIYPFHLSFYCVSESVDIKPPRRAKSISVSEFKAKDGKSIDLSLFIGIIIRGALVFKQN